MSVKIRGIGTALPKYAILQTDAAILAADRVGRKGAAARLLPVLYRKAGVRSRHSVLLDQPSDHPGDLRERQSYFPPARDGEDRGPTTEIRNRRYVEEAGPLALRAAAKALDEAGARADSVTHLITVSCSGFSAPGVDLELIEGLKLSPEVRRTHIGFMGCHGAINALRVAQAYCESDPNAVALVAAVELCSLHFQYGDDPEQMVANALFADGAAAAVCRSGEDADRPNRWKLEATASRIFPGSGDAMTWRIGDNGFVMTLSPSVPGLIEGSLASWMDIWLAKHDLTIGDVRGWAVHPGGPRILTSVETALKLPPEALAASRELLAEHGNMSSPTVLFLLETMARAADARPCVALGFGPGLAAEAALLR